GDGCSALCTIEVGWACFEPSPTATSTCTNTCGDGLVQRSEECDDGDANAELPDLCRPTCELPACGDGIVDSGEACDRGEMNSDGATDGCRTDCRDAYCGDGVLDSGEDCDPGTGPDTEASACSPEVCRAPVDMGVPADGGMPDAGSEATLSGGGCAAGGGSFGWLALVLLALVRRRR
ncbi:MAG: DUF4215 domain-containing protein, partial [Myxococcota bacterium]